MIRTLLPGVVAVVTAGAGSDQPLHPDEERLVASAVASRRAEFAAGRACARGALRALGLPSDVAILADQGRAPQWPDGVVGSITHGAGFTAAAAARRADVAALGIDAERRGELPEADLVAGDDERRAAAAVLGGDAGIVLFSAKESVYKAWYPAVGRWLGFTDVRVAVTPGGTFTVVPDDRLAAADRALLAALRGRYALDADRVYTAVHTPASPFVSPKSTSTASSVTQT